DDPSVFHSGAVASYDDVGVVLGTAYTYSVVAKDQAGNTSTSADSNEFTAVDTTPPTAPSGLTATLVGSDGADLSWTASDDNVGVTDYVVSRSDGTTTVTFHTGTTTSLQDTGLNQLNTYTYSVVAHDAVNNASSAS